MSTSRQNYLTCDGCNCPDEGLVIGDLGEPLANIRATARELGWAVRLPGGRDLCPVCKGKP